MNDVYKLENLRKARSILQAVLSKRLKMRQASLSQMERRKVLRTDSLRKYVEMLGGRLSIIAEFPDGESYRLVPFSSDTSVLGLAPNQLPEHTSLKSPPVKPKTELTSLWGDPTFLEVLDKVLDGALTKAVRQYQEIQET